MLPKKWNAEVIEFRGHYDGSVGMIIVQFKDYLRQKSEVKISIRPFYEKKEFHDLWIHYHSIALLTQPISFRLGWAKKKHLNCAKFSQAFKPLLNLINQEIT